MELLLLFYAFGGAFNTFFRFFISSEAYNTLNISFIFIRFHDM